MTPARSVSPLPSVTSLPPGAGRPSGFAAWLALATVALKTVALAADAPAPATAPSPARPAGAERPRELRLQTSDGVPLAAWYYRIPKDADPRATVILLHDLGGSHTSVEPLAKALQAAGCAVVAPDLRGHGASLIRGSSDKEAWKLLKPRDFEAMAASVGGRIRKQADARGDVETVSEWIGEQRERPDGEKEFPAALYVVGSGLGATVAAAWAAADAAWPDVVTGPQGRRVSGVVLVSPGMTTKGFALAPILARDPFNRDLHVLILAGAGDRDAMKAFDMLKRFRPGRAYDSRSPAPPKDEGTKPTLFLLQSAVDRSADALACHRSADPRQAAGDPAARIRQFFELPTDPPR